MQNYKLFCMPKQLCKLRPSVDSSCSDFEDFQKKNIKEIEILENQVLVIAKFVNPTTIIFEFRMLKNFEKIFEKKLKYLKPFDSYDHGLERIQAFSEVKSTTNSCDCQITLNVVDSQMINNYELYFEQSPTNLSLRFLNYKH